MVVPREPSASQMIQEEEFYTTRPHKLWVQLSSSVMYLLMPSHVVLSSETFATL